MNGQVESVERVHCQHNDEYECAADQGVDNPEENPKAPVPANLWSPCSEDSLSEKKIDDVDKEDTGVDEDVCSDSYRHIVRFARPDDT